MSLCRVPFFWTEEASNWSTWRLFEFTERFLSQAITVRITVHCRALLHDHCRAYGNCDCRNCWKDWAALSCHWPWFDWLPTGKVQPTGGKHTESARTGLRKCFGHWNAGTNTGRVWGCWDQRLTVGHPSCHCRENSLWDTEEHCTDTEGKIEAYTDFNRLYLDHCWTTGSLQLGVQLNTAESRTGFGILLPFTVKELMEPLQMELNCNKIFGTNCRGLVGHCILTVNQLELMHEDVITDCSWQSLFTDEPLPKKSRSRLATSQEETGTAKVDVKITGLPVGSEEVTVTITGHWDWVYLRVLWGNCFWTLLCWLMYWSLGSRFTEEAHLHTAPRLIDTVQLITDCVFHWLASMIDHCMHVQVCDTDSLNQCQGEVLTYMHCTHTTAHSNDTVKHTHCLAQAGLKYLAQVTDKKADWVYTGLTWIAHC